MTTLADYFTSLSEDDLKSTAYNTLTALGFKVTNWRSGGIARTLVALFAGLLSPLTVLQVEVNQSGFLDYAVGSTGPNDPATVGLQVCAKQIYNVDVVLATFASGEVTLNNSGGGVYSFAPFECVFSRSSTGKTYTNTAAFSIGSMATGIVPIQAQEVGSASSAGAGEVDTIVTSMLGVSCSNAAAVVGEDTETNASLISRCRAKTESISAMGPSGIYDYVARTPALNGGSVCNRTNRDGNHTDGTVDVYCASPSGIVTAPDIAKLQAAFDYWARPICIEPTAISATAVPVPVTYTAYVLASANVTSAALELAAEAALEAYFANAPIGGWVISGVGKIFQNAIEAVIRTSVISGAVAQVVVAAPSGDVTLLVNEVATLGLVTPTVVFI